MKTLIATLLATAVSASFAHAATMPNDPAAYRDMTQKAAADYKAAVATCAGMSGHVKAICKEEAKVARARADADAVAQYNNTPKSRITARSKLADADYALAKAKCADMTGADKDNCVNNARSIHTAALADAKAGREAAMASTTNSASPVTTTATTDATKAAAVDKCAQIDGKPTTGCLIDNRTAAGTGAATMAQKTENAAETAAQKNREVGATVADKTERAVDTVAATTERAAEKTGAVVADSVITTKVKADIFKEPELKSMAIHVETDKGVVMLSGFVDSKADAEKAVNLAKNVKGVTQVKSAIKVK